MNRQISISPRILREARTQTGKTLQSLVLKKPTLLFFMDDACDSCKLVLKDISRKRSSITANGAGIAFVYKATDIESENLIKNNRLGDLPRIKDSTGDLFHAFKYHPKSFGKQYLERDMSLRAFPVLGLKVMTRRAHIPCLFLVEGHEIRAAGVETPLSIDQILMDWFPDDSFRILTDWTEPSQMTV